MRNLIVGGFAVVLVAIALGGCDSLTKGCTLIGCTDQLTVKFTRGALVTYDVKLTFDGKSAQFTCDNGTPRNVSGVQVSFCNQSSFTIEGTPSSVHVSVSCGLAPDDGGVTDCEGSFDPSYTVSRPNGPECEPECKQATVDL